MHALRIFLQRYFFSICYCNMRRGQNTHAFPAKNAVRATVCVALIVAPFERRDLTLWDPHDFAQHAHHWLHRPSRIASRLRLGGGHIGLPRVFCFQGAMMIIVKQWMRQNSTRETQAWIPVPTSRLESLMWAVNVRFLVFDWFHLFHVDSPSYSS